MPVRTLAILVGLVATILVGWVFHVGAGILQPLVIAAFLCSMLQPVVHWLAKRYVPPAVTVIVLVTLLFLGIARVGAWAQEEIRRFVGVPPAARTTPGVPRTPPPIVDEDGVPREGEIPNGDLDDPLEGQANSSDPGSESAPGDEETAVLDLEPEVAIGPAEVDPDDLDATEENLT